MIRGQSISLPTTGSRPFRWVLLSACLLVICLSSTPWALDPVLVKTGEVLPGLHLLRYDIVEPGTKAAYVLRLEIGRPELTLRVGLAHGTVKSSRERTSDIARRYEAPGYEVIAAVNASFFDENGTPLGAIIDRGSLLKTFRGWNRAVFGWTGAHRPLNAAGLSASGSQVVFSDGATCPIHGINDGRGENHLVLYTPEYDLSTGTSPGGVELTVRGVNFPLSPRKEVTGTISAFSEDIGNETIPGDAVVLSAAGSSAPPLIRHATIGDQVRIRIGFSEAVWNAAEVMVTGAGWLLRDGTPEMELWERYDEGFRGLHPRTIVGWDDEFLYLVAVDGRQAGYSEGMTFPEMAEFMKDTLGCREAINLDGGGSTTMVVGGDVVNRPSDGTERPVSNALLIVRDPLVTPLPIEDRFLPSGREGFWRDRFTRNGTEAFEPPAPEGDGTILRVLDPAGGFESIRVGKNTDRDYSVSAWFYCDYRPELAGLGFDRVALFARDAGDGAFDSPSAGSSNCYALTWDSDDGRLRAGLYRDGGWEDILEDEDYLPSSGWRRFRIDCRDDSISWLVNDELLTSATDSTHPLGACGVAYREEFSEKEHIWGAVIENFLLAPLAP